MKGLTNITLQKLEKSCDEGAQREQLDCSCAEEQERRREIHPRTLFYVALIWIVIQLHVKRNNRGMFIFISHGNSLIGICWILRKSFMSKCIWSHECWHTDVQLEPNILLLSVKSWVFCDCNVEWVASVIQTKAFFMSTIPPPPLSWPATILLRCTLRFPQTRLCQTPGFYQQTQARCVAETFWNISRWHWLKRERRPCRSGQQIWQLLQRAATWTRALWRWASCFTVQAAV